MPPNHPYFFSCDWGTSSFRLRLVRSDDLDILTEIKTGMGVKILASQLPDSTPANQRARAFHDYLAEQVVSILRQHSLPLESCAVMVSGMASSTVGWMELPYTAVPFPINGSQALVKKLPLSIGATLLLPVLLVSGVATDTDMMRGEETQLIGILANPTFAPHASDCRIILPGTHSKHIVVAQGQMIDFRTHMSGELMAVLCQHSILRFTTVATDEQPDDAAFREGVQASRKDGLSRSLFQTRSRAVLLGQSPQSNRDYLSGLLIGTEWMDLLDDAAPGPIIVAASAAMARRYAHAAEVLGAPPQVLITSDAQLDQAAVLGHQHILRHWENRPSP